MYDSRKQDISKTTCDQLDLAEEEQLRVLLDKPPDIETPIVWGQLWFGCFIKSTYSGGLPKLKSLDLGACTVPWDANQVLELKKAFFGRFT